MQSSGLPTKSLKKLSIRKKKGKRSRDYLMKTKDFKNSLN